MLEGVHTALITPFAGGRLDAGRLPGLVDRQIEGGVSGLVPAGTTGESPTLHPREHLELIRQVVQAAGGRVPVIAGTGANCTREAVELTAEAQRAGADASLQVAPYYNKPSQEGLYRHFREIARATSLPLVLYSVPGRCAVSIEVPTLARLHRECPSIVGIKEASGQVDRVSRIREELGSGFLILSGDDATALPFLAAGAAGVVSVASNLLPGEVSGMVRRFLRDGDPQGGAEGAPEALRPLPGSLPRNQPGPDQDRDGRLRADRARDPPPAGRHGGIPPGTPAWHPPPALPSGLGGTGPARGDPGLPAVAALPAMRTWQRTERRLRLSSIVQVLLSLAMLLAGIFLIEPWLEGLLFLAWWFLCFLLALSALLCALLDFLILRRVKRALGKDG